MSELPLHEPTQCALVLVDEQAGLAFVAGYLAPQLLRSNGLAVANTAVAFGVPVVISTSASRTWRRLRNRVRICPGYDQARLIRKRKTEFYATHRA